MLYRYPPTLGTALHSHHMSRTGTASQRKAMQWGREAEDQRPGPEASLGSIAEHLPLLDFELSPVKPEVSCNDP